MKKSLIALIFGICCAVILSSLIFSGGPVKTTAAAASPAPVVSAEESALLDILNSNFVYGSDFDNVDNIVDCSANNFKSSVGEDGYIPDKLITEFIYDMYGIEIVDLSKLHPEHLAKEGYVYTVAGCTLYKHKNIKLTANEDGTITAITDIAVTSLSGDTENLSAKTLFVKNENSKYGYNIVYSEIFSANALI